jgi:hypothetical protein
MLAVSLCLFPPYRSVATPHFRNFSNVSAQGVFTLRAALRIINRKGEMLKQYDIGVKGLI